MRPYLALPVVSKHPSPKLKPAFGMLLLHFAYQYPAVVLGCTCQVCFSEHGHAGNCTQKKVGPEMAAPCIHRRPNGPWELWAGVVFFVRSRANGPIFALGEEGLGERHWQPKKFPCRAPRATQRKTLSQYNHICGMDSSPGCL